MFEGDGLGAGNGRSGARVEDLLLDRRVHRELLDDPVDDLSPLHVSSLTGLLEPLEQLLHGVMVGFEKGDRIHDTEVPASAPSQTSKRPGWHARSRRLCLASRSTSASSPRASAALQ